MDPAREQKVIRLQPRQLDPGLDGVSLRRGDLELHRTLGFMQHHDGARCQLIPMAEVADLEGYEVAPSQFAVDAKVEQGEFTDSALQLQSDSQSPDVLQFELRLLFDDLASVPRLAVNSAGNGIHDSFLSG